MNRTADEAFSKTGLSPSHALLLYIVNLKCGIQKKEIGETLHLTPFTITRLIEKLELKGFVSNKVEGKNAYLCTTPDGLALQSEITTLWDRLRDKYNGILTKEETARFIEISGKLSKELDGKTN